MSRSIRAHFDGRVFVPDEPVDAPINTPLRLSIENGQAAVEAPSGKRDFDHRMQRLMQAAGCITAPVLSDEQLSRDGIYDDNLP